MAVVGVRIYLAGRVAIEAGSCFLDSHTFPGSQGRLAFAFLVTERGRPVSRSELAEVIWPEELPASGESALNAIVSKLRTLVARAGIDGATLSGGRGCYELCLPSDVWVDVEAAADAIHDAESALRTGDPAGAYGPSAVAHHIARRPLLPGETGRWVESRREKLRNVLVRALECRARVYLWNHEFSLAVEAARSAIELEPFRETSYQILMRAHAGAGNAAEALWTYERCRRLISKELGVSPSQQTRAIHDEILRGARG